MEIAYVIAHAMHFRLLPSLSLPAGGGPGAILVVVKTDLAVQGVQGVQKVRTKRTSGSSKKVNLGGDGEVVSSPALFSGVISWD